MHANRSLESGTASPVDIILVDETHSASPPQRCQFGRGKLNAHHLCHPSTHHLQQQIALCARSHSPAQGLITVFDSLGITRAAVSPLSPTVRGLYSYHRACKCQVVPSLLPSNHSHHRACKCQVVPSPSWTMPIPISPSLWSLVNPCDRAKDETYATAKKLGQELLDSCRGVVGQPPLYKDGEMFFRGMRQIS